MKTNTKILPALILAASASGSASAALTTWQVSATFYRSYNISSQLYNHTPFSPFNSNIIVDYVIDDSTPLNPDLTVGDRFSGATQSIFFNSHTFYLTYGGQWGQYLTKTTSTGINSNVFQDGIKIIDLIDHCPGPAQNSLPNVLLAMQDHVNCGGSPGLSLNFVLDGLSIYVGYTVDSIKEVPLPAGAWLFGSCLTGLVGLHRKSKSS